MDRIILHCDCNGFYASVELPAPPGAAGRAGGGVRRPGQPPRHHSGEKRAGQGASASRRRRPSGRPGANARTWCCCRPTTTRYSAYSQQVNDIYEQLHRPGGALRHRRELAGCHRQPPPVRRRTPRHWPTGMRAAVREELGLTISVGVSFNKIFAKLGSDYKKPDATTVITRENFQEHRLAPAGDGSAVRGPRRRPRCCGQYGVHTIGELAAFDRQALVNAAGQAGGPTVELRQRSGKQPGGPGGTVRAAQVRGQAGRRSPTTSPGGRTLSGASPCWPTRWPSACGGTI